MASFNTSHHESGGVVLFSGELILLYCDNVSIGIENKSQNSSGRIYLTTHRIVFTSTPINQNPNLKSFSAPFYAMFDLSLEQPVFGANYIKGKVRPESTPDSTNGVTFKLKFSSGGAIEFGQAMDNAAKQANNNARSMHFQPPPAYTATVGQFYQAPPTVYQPAYNCGFALPTQVFSTPPPAGFVYAMEAPPPYPGLNTAPQQYPVYPQTGFPAQQVYPQTGFPAEQAYPQTGFPAQQAYQSQPYGVFPTSGPNVAIYQNGASAPPPPGAPGFAFNERPPTYDEAIKKIQ